MRSSTIDRVRTTVVYSFASVIVVAIAFAANGVKGSVLGSEHAVGYFVALFWLLTPLVLTPMLAAQSQDIFWPPYFLVPAAVTAAVATGLWYAVRLARERFGKRATLIVMLGSMALAVGAGFAAPVIVFEFTF